VATAPTDEERSEEIMAHRSVRKQHPARPTGAAGRIPMLAIVGGLVGAAALGAWLLWPATPSTTTTDAGAPAAGEPTPQISANAAAKAAIGPHTQATYPPIPFQAYEPPRAPAVIESAYRFAAEHPEVSSYVPCFCGCERSGHEGNTDCFVKSRAPNGDVTEWDPHGVDCAVCIDVANRSRQMHAAGASVRDIRAAIDKEFAPVYPGKMPTPHPPGAHATH
jgi:Protein of unknown function with PCYCGC motif